MMKLYWKIEGDNLVIELTRTEEDGCEFAESSIRIPRGMLVADTQKALREAIRRA